MPGSYSQDFRRKVIEYVKKGNSCHRASLKFEIASNTVRNWYKRYELEGNYLSRKVGGKKGRVSKEEIESYIRKNPNFILSDMGKHFGMSAPGALYWLKKLGYSYKKKTSPMWKQAKKREKNTQKR
jgi:transposase